MTGKELKAFAEMIHDDAVIQVDWGAGYRTDWKELKQADIQATLSPVELNAQEVKP